MKSLSIVLITAFFFLMASCAHKSGHKGTVLRSTGKDSEINDARDGANTRTSNMSDERIKLDGAEIFATYNTAVFMVYTSDGFNKYQGSGFFINSDGLAVSSYHVFKYTKIGAEHIRLPNSNQRHKVVDVIHSDELEDFIIFRVNVRNTNFIPLARFKPRVGEKVYSIGSPHGLENTFSSGEVSQWRDRNLMQISVLIDHGSSGGALINEYGEAVGITAGTFADGSQANLNYAWSIDVIKPYIDYK